mgnify:FL=1
MPDVGIYPCPGRRRCRDQAALSEEVQGLSRPRWRRQQDWQEVRRAEFHRQGVAEDPRSGGHHRDHHQRQRQEQADEGLQGQAEARGDRRSREVRQGLRRLTVHDRANK